MSENATPAAPPTEAPKRTPSLLRLWFGLREPVSQRAYLTSGVALMAFKYAVDAGLAYFVTHKFFSPLDYINPVFSIRAKAFSGGPEASTPEALLIFMAAFALPFLWIGVSMTIRRAVDAGWSPWIGMLFFVPGINYLTMLVLATRPSVTTPSWPHKEPEVVVDAQLTSALLGVAAGVGIALAMFGLEVFLLHSYGAGLFFGTPVFMGASAGFLHNKGHPRSMSSTIMVACISITIAALALLLFALEGILCLAMAAPIAAGLGILGAIVGRAIALGGKTSASTAVALFIALPALGGAEAGMGAPLERSVTTTRDINASPEVVWKNVVEFSELAPPTQWFFETGVAYPLRARIDGRGVGAVRRCEFSTGAFVEPIAVWDEPHRLAFDVTAQPQPMKEWSPYAFVNAPHLERSLKSRHGEFLLTPLDGGKRTLLQGTTWYTLDMAPALYWRIWTEWLLHAIHSRVLDHIATLSESER